MDFTKLEEAPHRRKHMLAARLLSVAEAKQILAPLITGYEGKTSPITLFGADSAKTWTVAAMTNLSGMGQKIARGRLRRVLRTALPINPEFNLFLNGNRVEPEKLSQTRIGTWVIGQNDNSAKSLDFEESKIGSGIPAIKIPQLGPIWGEVELFEDALAFGKSEDWGRSHGFFVIVRGRLLNIQDELFGLEALSHGAFQRFRMIVHADGLDEHLRATRENVSEDAEGVKNFRRYLKEKFNEVRAVYNTWLTEKEKQESISHHLGRTPKSLSRQPLLSLIRRVLRGEISEVRYLRVPTGLDVKAKDALLADLEQAIQSDEFFKDVRFEALGLEQGVAVFEVTERCFKINILHPFYTNYAEHYHSPEPYQFFAIAEVLTEAYLSEEGLTEEQIGTILGRRDRFLRELVFGSRLAAPLVAQLLEDSRNDSKGFENAVYEGMKSLGFEVSKLGEKGKPDGIALARRGVQTEGGKSASYRVTYDAKSTGAKVSAKDLNIAGALKHRKELEANFSLIVSPAYDGDGDPGSDAVKHAIEHNVSLVTLDDFVTLVLVAASRPLGFRRLREQFFEKCRGPRDVHQWIEQLLNEKGEDVPLNEILDVIWEIQSDSPDPPKFASIRERLAHHDARFKNLSEGRIREWVESLMRLEGSLITIERDRVSLENPPEVIMQRISNQTQRIKQISLKGSMYESLLKNAAKVTGKPMQEEKLPKKFRKIKERAFKPPTLK